MAPHSRSGRCADAVAVVLGNASLLGVGYLLLRRWVSAIVNALVVAGLVGLLVSVERDGWVRVLALLWSITVSVHGWYLAAGGTTLSGTGETTRSTSRVWGQRLVATSAAAVVVVAIGWLRIDAQRIEAAAAEAHRAGECRIAKSILGGLSFGHELVDPRVRARASDSNQACNLLIKAEREASHGNRLAAVRALERYDKHHAALWKGAENRQAELLLEEATHQFDAAAAGNTGALATGFSLLATVQRRFPGRTDGIDEVVDGFLHDLPALDPCEMATITDRLAERTPDVPGPDRATARVARTIPRIAPDAIVRCADNAMEQQLWEEARARYRQLLDQYPHHASASKARRGIREAALGIQWQNVNWLLSDGAASGRPKYCDSPAPYDRARPYRGPGKGPYPAILYGQDQLEGKLPLSWRANLVQNAVLVICAGSITFGSLAESCEYTGDNTVKFWKYKVPVSVYELRTGKLVTKTSLQVNGASCPAFLKFDLDNPDSELDRYVTPSASNVAGSLQTVDRSVTTEAVRFRKRLARHAGASLVAIVAAGPDQCG